MCKISISREKSPFVRKKLTSGKSTLKVLSAFRPFSRFAGELPKPPKLTAQ